jgi:glucose-induced degradation protein 4
MPSEHPAALVQPHDDQPQQQQIKLCSSCHRPLSVDASNSSFLLYDDVDANDTSIVCGPCRSSLTSHRIESSPVFLARGEFLFAQVERELRRRAEALPDGNSEAGQLQPPSLATTAQNSAQFSLDDIEMDTAPTPRPRLQTPSHPPSASSSASQLVSTPQGGSTSAVSSRKPLRVDVRSPHHQAPSHSQTAQRSAIPISRAPSNKSQPQHMVLSYPDPMIDITHLRVRSQGHQCLYPGASFQGTQKSGRNSYDVNVTIVVCTLSFSIGCFQMC